MFLQPENNKALDDQCVVSYRPLFKEALPFMLNLREVEEAKVLMNEAVRWSVMRWLAEKKRVRKAADLANDTLDVFEKKVKTGWSDELKAAYEELVPAGKSQPKTKEKKVKVDSDVRAAAIRIKQADDEAYKAHMDAEETFDVAEKRLSTAMAREGTQKAILSWELHEKAIMMAQELVQSKASSK